jgi:NAD-specific glutamate dehydrogenase
MSRTLRIIAAAALAVALGLGAFWLARLLRPKVAPAACTTHHCSELSWMKSEFGLDDEEFRKVEQLHNDYVPRCDELCSEIAGATAKVQRIALHSDSMTPELAAALREYEATRSECQKELLEHLYETARCMPPDKAQRFLDIALPAALADSHASVHSAMSH